MPFGFARVSHHARPETAPGGREAETGSHDGLSVALTEPLDEAAPFEFEHVHGDTCSCNLRGE
jgi:hypothetical protein